MDPACWPQNHKGSGRLDFAPTTRWSEIEGEDKLRNTGESVQVTLVHVHEVFPETIATAARAKNFPERADQWCKTYIRGLVRWVQHTNID